jgi:hypothetical protein
MEMIPEPLVVLADDETRRGTEPQTVQLSASNKERATA